ncbi:MAG: hypothetical protein KC910_32390 [Candidatus Eremiobacteraeota bacterium]|nr:hypothetical protein [Candidatus Eremiobacteraeota bacterium]
MNQHVPSLLVVVPLMGAFLTFLAGLYRGRQASLAVVLMVLTGNLSLAASLFGQVGNLPLRYVVGGWEAPYGIELVVDRLSILMLALIAVVALLSAVHSVAMVAQDIDHKAPAFYALFLLLVTALNGICVTGDAFNLYVMLEISSLATYGLIALGGGRAFLATFHYIIMGTIGASFYLLGVGYLYIKTGTLNMADLAARLPAVFDSPSAKVGLALMVVGVLLKMALFPLHAWLPNAYTYAPDATSTLVAPLSTKVSVYIMIRMTSTIFGRDNVFTLTSFSDVIVILASIGIVAGSCFALAQRDLKKTLSYIIVAEAGYMVGGIWLNSSRAFAGAVFHILNDALVTLGLFMVAGSLMYYFEARNLKEMPNFFKEMTPTSLAFFVLAMSVVGMPPTSGFFSKFYLVGGALEKGHPEFALALLFASLANAFVFLRIFERAHYHPVEIAPRRAMPATMTLATLLVALAVVGLGMSSGMVYSQFIFPFTGWP